MLPHDRSLFQGVTRLAGGYQPGAIGNASAIPIGFAAQSTLEAGALDFRPGAAAGM